MREWLLRNKLLTAETFTDALGIGEAMLEVVKDAMSASPTTSKKPSLRD
jgi:hypothetical protein